MITRLIFLIVIFLTLSHEPAHGKSAAKLKSPFRKEKHHYHIQRRQDAADDGPPNEGDGGNGNADDHEDDEEEFSCPPGFYKCVNDTSCIKEEYVCDTMEDCYLNDDEENCSDDCSDPHMFSCDEGKTCLSREYEECDGIQQCDDGTDEAGEGCFCDHTDDNFFLCEEDGVTCLHVDRRCDVTWNCPNGTDEANCPEN